MASDADRTGRASNYVLGLLKAEERERAERDLERDPAFRQAVIDVAERMHLFDIRTHAPEGGDAWRTIAAAIGDMPHMPRKAADADTRQIIRPQKPQLVGQGLHATGGRRGFVIAAGLIAAFALGYAVGTAVLLW